MFKALFLAAALLAPATLHAKDAKPQPDAGKVISRAAEKFISPGYARFHGDMAMLKTAMDDLCTTPGPSAFAEVRADFAAAVASWSAISIIRIGPIAENNRLARIVSWPDPDGSATAGIKAAIAGHDKALANAKSLAAASPALQGLTALEYVLYGEGAKDLRGSGGSFRCHYGAAIAQNVQTIAENVQKAWDDPKGFRALWTSPGPQNATYHDRRKMLADLVEQFSDAFRLVRTALPAGMAEGGETDTAGAGLPFSLSHNSFQAIAAELDGMRLLFESSKMRSLLKPNDRWIADSIAFEFRNAHDTLAFLTHPDTKLPASEREKARARAAEIIARLSDLFTVKLTRALGVAGAAALSERG